MRALLLMRITNLICLSTLLLSCTSQEDKSKHKTDYIDSPLFTELTSEQTGIAFQNVLIEDLASGFNILDFDYFFNGAGVGLADFNNDGLIDIVLSANQAKNRIYKNLGDMKFEDVTETSGINHRKNWSTGVSIVDINKDGLEDIYISQGGPHIPEQRKNLLYINQGNFSFLEEADNYNLGDTGISSQAVFFDYDKDGDLDCLVVNESPLIGYDPVRFYKLLSNHNATLWKGSTSHLYRNDNNQYIDITENTDIDKPSFGLGVCVSDLNDDGWQDIYIANDYYIPDAIYINDQQGGFRDETEKLTNQLSFFGMGVDIADLNNDTYKDILVLDMASDDHIRAKTLMESMDVENFRLLTQQLKFPYQYMFNTFQLNNGGGQFDNTAHAIGLAKTDWSWAGLMADFDLDGDKDVFVTNGYRKYAKDNDFRLKVRSLQEKYNGEVPLEEKQRLYSQIPSEKLHNLFFENSNSGKFIKKTKKAGINVPTFSNGAAYADLDNDGDLDLIVNNIDQDASIYKNNTIENSSGNSIIIVNDLKEDRPFTISIENKGITQMYESNKVRGYLSSCDDNVIVGIGDEEIVDKLTISILDGPTQTFQNIKQSSTFKLTDLKDNPTEQNAVDFKFKEVDLSSIGIDFVHRENNYDDFAKEVLLPYKQSTLGPFISVVDINKDNNDDFYISGAKGQNGKLYQSQKNNSFQSKQSNDLLYLEEMKACFIDLNNDSQLDIYVPSGGNSEESASAYLDQLIINDSDNLKRTKSELSEQQFSGKLAITIDYDGDGDDDLFVGNRMKIQSYPLAASSFLFENNSGNFKNVTKDVFNQTEFGIINDVIATDFNHDGWQDLIIVGEWNSIQFWTNLRGKFTNQTDILVGEDLTGWWNKIIPIDINKDHRTDYVIGNLGINSKYKAQKNKPLNVYANDFDNNGSLDFVLSKEYKGKEVPYRGRECSSEQMPFISQDFKSYAAFANASLKEIYGNGLEASNKYSITEFSSVILVQGEDNKFEIKTLPFEAQLRPILDAVTIDLNEDGYLDLIAIGNIYNTEPETPRLDYHTATVLLSDKEGNFIYNQDLSNQLLLNGSSKSIGILRRHNKTDLLIIGVNNGTPLGFEILN